jgi:hypothetical protein
LTELFGGELRVREFHKMTREDVEWANIVVFQRESSEYIVALSDTVRVDLLLESLRIVSEDERLNVELAGIGPREEFFGMVGCSWRCCRTCHIVSSRLSSRHVTTRLR